MTFLEGMALSPPQEAFSKALSSWRRWKAFAEAQRFSVSRPSTAQVATWLRNSAIRKASEQISS